MQQLRINDFIDAMNIKTLNLKFFLQITLLSQSGRRCLKGHWMLAAILVFITGLSSNDSLEAQTNNLESKKLTILSVRVDDKSFPTRVNQEVRVGANPETVTFNFGPLTNSDWLPNRLRYRLDGYENAWHEGDATMNFSVRFYNTKGDQVSQKVFNINGESAGWDGSLKNSPLTHRRETVTIPRRASRLMAVISSAGPPATEGIYVVANLVVSEIESNNLSGAALLESPLDQPRESYNSEGIPSGWARDGLNPSMAKIVSIGHDPVARAFAILDDDPISHAEWRNSLGTAPQVTPGGKLVLEWNEMYSMGLSDIRTATYQKLSPGTYNFQVQEINIYGIPTGIETSLKLIVSPPFWATAWFWSVVLAIFVMAVIGLVRYVTWRKMRDELMALKSQQALEQERVRIAQDIHDDLGARVTQISLLSAMAQDNLEFSEKARSEFAQVSQMSRDLVAALYETVWAVNPENDNLDAMGNYICQMVTTVCDQSHLRCRFYVSELPEKPPISSQTRHNLSMAVKEAVHNVIKHAKASEVIIRIEFAGEVLHISVSDNGCGFQISGQVSGNGLINMRRRLEDIGGTCLIESEPGKGTTIHMRLTVSKSLAHLGF